MPQHAPLSGWCRKAMTYQPSACRVPYPPAASRLRKPLVHVRG
ncbi:hypothetical protein XCR_3457 [Xanthomonas campestris pv. raphani 756C]|nr:hypothetical protein XCR_3457 [Xanthomonas campestris pv. raphani 756C]